MPELPEVETVRLALTKHLLKCKIFKVKINSKKLRYTIPENFTKLINGCKIISIKRRGKYIILNFDNMCSLLIHLGMTGTFRFSKIYNPLKHDHLVFNFKSFYLIYNDIRKFGFLKIYNSNEVFDSKHLTKLGPEPFSEEFNFKYLSKALKKRKIHIKNFLMNQNVIAGLGNIYCSEVLFESKISPMRITNNLNAKEILSVYISIKRVLKKAISYGGTSLKNYKDPNGKIGYFKNKLKVYGKENKKCSFCNKNIKIKKIIQQGRSTFFCENCQI